MFTQSVEWKPISGIPDQYRAGSRVILWAGTAVIGRYRKALKPDGCSVTWPAAWVDDEGMVIDGVTHWMPMLKGPET